MLGLQLAISGIATGSIYALIALGIVLIYKCSGVVNFAQGAYAMLGAYVSYAMLRLGLPAIVAVLGSMVVLALTGVATERLILRRMLKAQIVSVMMVTLGLLIFFKAFCLAIWGPDQIAFPQIFPSGSIDFAGILITYNYLAAFAFASVLSIVFLLFYRYTSIGLMQRCAADNSRAALAIGIHVSNQVSIAWAASAALAGLGGTLLATLGGLSLNISDIGLIAFPVIVVGGLESLAGALIAGFLLGMLEAFTEGMLSPTIEDFLRQYTTIQSVGSLQQIIPYALLVLMLLIRPQGIFGRQGTERV